MSEREKSREREKKSFCCSLLAYVISNFRMREKNECEREREANERERENVEKLKH